ncbi:hypothetical protein BC940DRAFT_289565 [Gongronella butleri]|nr:hypothetical protein BC940DRAFT_289565 [Gongronella butleri]
MSKRGLPNELLLKIIDHVERPHAFLLVCRYTYHYVSPRIYRRALFPDQLPLYDILHFCQRHGSALTTLKLPLSKRFADTFYRLLFQLCPSLAFLQASMTAKQLVRLLPHRASACFLITHCPSSELDMHTLADTTHTDYHTLQLPCCSSFLLFPQAIPTLTHLPHYFHHPGALRNAILPTFGADLLSMSLNMYDILTVQVAQWICHACPKLRYLHVPQIRAEGLWMLLRQCNTLVAVVVGSNPHETHHHPFEQDEDDEHAPDLDDDARAYTWAKMDGINRSNQQAVKSMTRHRRVWGLHPLHSSPQSLLAWHIGILPKQ